MKIFNIINDHNQINISSQRHVNKLIEDIKLKSFESENEILLNIEGCQTDYPNTPRLIDFFLNHLAKIDGKKVLKIKYDGLGTKEIYILYDIILEGNFFNIKEKIETDQELDKWKSKMNSILRSNNILLEIHYTPDNKTYIYGE